MKILSHAILATRAAIVFALAAMAYSGIALAQTADPSITPVSTAILSIHFGDILAAIAPYFSTIIFGVAVYLMRYLPSGVYATLQTMHVEAWLGQAVVYGMNCVKNAEAGKVLTVDVASPVAAEALDYILTHAPSWLSAELGTPAQIAALIWARLPVAADVSRPDFDAIADQAL